MRQLSAQVQMYIAIGVIVVVTLAVAFLVILPLFQEASAIKGEIATEQQNLATAQALLARRQSAKAQSAANEVELMRIANAIPDAPQLPSVIIELQDIANASGVEFISLSPSDLTLAAALPDGTVPAFSSVPMSLTLSGSWSELIDYMNRVHALDRGVRVTTSSFTYVPATEEEPAFINASVTLEVYVMAASTTTGASAP
ncbi:MAG: hypothetical protein EG823_08835 [Actinobacteria bacterium]|nr:hypothetical protein [Actinomycetota bacterium]